MTRVACSPALEASMDLVQAIWLGVIVGVRVGVRVGVGVGVGPSDLPQRRQPVSPSDGTKGVCYGVSPRGCIEGGALRGCTKGLY